MNFLLFPSNIYYPIQVFTIPFNDLPIPFRFLLSHSIIFLSLSGFYYSISIFWLYISLKFVLLSNINCSLSTMKKLALLFMSLLVSFSMLYAQNNGNSLLWKISGNGLEQSSYVYGTFHLLCPEKIFFHCSRSRPPAR